ncbi:MAG: histone deacetylase family protein [Pseudomonadota bacterium]
MRTVHSEAHRRRAPKTELSGGQFVPPYECPERVDMILTRLSEVVLGPVEAPIAHGRAPLERLHAPAYLEFLEAAWRDWSAEGHIGEAIAYVWPARRMTERVPNSIEARMGYFSFSADTAIDAGTWEAARAAADVAITAAGFVAGGEHAAFALCRPPGHHAARDMYGGYSFLNNAGLAAQTLLDQGAERIAVLDVDFHHGNGTQDIFWQRDDVFFASLHGAPEHAFPHFSGYSDESGTGAGEGATLNLPLAPGTAWEEWSHALATACNAIADHGTDALVVSLGADTFENDPISFFKLRSEDFLRVGSRIAKLGLPTVFVLEGGYAVDALGKNIVNTLEGFEAG